MPTYQYKARDKFSKVLSGVMAGESENAVIARLNQLDYVPVSIKEIESSESFLNFFDRFTTIKFSELNMFTRQLATLQKAGLPLLLSLTALKDQTSNIKFKNFIGQIGRDVEAGSSLSAAFEKFPRLFNVLYVNMIASGEASGRLDEILERLSYLGEYEEKTKQRVKAATRYPLIVVIAMLIGFFVLTTLVIPRYAQIYSSFSAQLPLPTQILLGIHYCLTHFWWLVILFVIGLSVGFRSFIHTTQGRWMWDNFKLKVPIFGPLMLKLAMSRFTRVTGTLMRSGLPLLKILDIASKSTGNVVVARAIEQIKNNITEGKGMTEPMKISGLFPPVVTQMVAVGEETGKLDQLLIHVSSYYDEEVEYMISNLTSLIEPLLIVFLGCCVLFMALGIFLPMWNLMSLFRK